MKLIIILSAAALLVVAACAPAKSPTDVGAPTGAPGKDIAELTLALSNPGNEALDPMLSPGDNMPYLRLLYDPIMGFDRDSNEISKATGIAEDWALSADGRVFTITVRKGVKFHDGTEVTAEDVQFTLQRAFAKEARAAGIQPIRSIVGKPDNIVVTGRYTVELRLAKHGFPLTIFLTRQSSGETLVVPKAYVEKVGAEEFGKNPIGTGPYKLVERKVGSHITLESAGDHFSAGKARVKKVTFRWVAEESTRAAMLRKSEADVIDVGVEQSAAMKSSGFRIYQHGMPDVALLYFQLYRTTKPLNDVRVREALGIAINKPEINEFLFKGLASESGNFIASGALAYQKADPWPYDLARAKTLMKEAGYEKGFDISLQGFPKAGWAVVNILESIASAWSKIGVRATITYRDYGTYRAEWGAKKLPDPVVVLHPIPGKDTNLGFFQDTMHTKGSRLIVTSPELDSLIDQLGTTTEFERYKALEAAVEKELLATRAFIPLFEHRPAIATNDKVEVWTIGKLSSSGLNLRYIMNAAR